MANLLEGGEPPRAEGERHMTDRGQFSIDLEAAHASANLEEAFDHLSLGVVIFNAKREVVFCNKRYMEMYGLSPALVKPGTPTSELIRHRLNLGLKVQITPDDYVRERVGREIALDTTVQEVTDGRIVAYTSTRCLAAAGWRPTRTSPSAKSSMPA